jgi:two-component system, NtrC family, sensor kinase
VDYMREELPPALTRVAEGLSRITEIVRSMKVFSHADQREMGEVDLNCSISSTLVVARSEYRDVADVETNLSEIPRVTCHGGQINQVVLNLVVNAAHAIGDQIKKGGTRGRINVRTHEENGRVIISIADTGGGIPEAIRAHIFDPFFTTKEVGRGTGQGLSVSRNVVVKGHGGELDFITEPGKGTTFFVRLPIAGVPSTSSS